MRFPGVYTHAELHRLKRHELNQTKFPSLKSPEVSAVAILELNSPQRHFVLSGKGDVIEVQFAYRFNT